MRKLHEVNDIHTTMPCVIYALLRTGRHEMVRNFRVNRIIKLMKRYDETVTLEKGDIVFWKFDMYTEYHPTYIDEAGRITNMAINFPYHAGVYEGDDRVTDMVLAENDRRLPMHIRMRLLSEISKPNYYMR